MAPMKEAHVHADTVTFHDVPVPSITQPSQILIKILAASCNPKDWKMAIGDLMTISECPNRGDDIVAIVEAVGDDVHDFKTGDRVAALHELGTPHGSYADFEEGATVPMAALMASIGLFAMFGVTPDPWAPAANLPLVVYRAASAVGSAVIRPAQIADVHPLICLAGKGVSFVETLNDRSKGDVIIDYREGSDAVVEKIRKSLNGTKLDFGFHAISEKQSHHNLAKVLEPNTGKVSFVLGGHREDLPGGIQQSTTMAGSLWKEMTPLGKRDRLGI